MKGITIIEEHLCRVVELRQLIALGIFFTLLCVGVLAFYRYTYKDAKNKCTKRLIIACSIGIVIICIILWAHQIYNYNNIHYEYVVEVDDTVTFNDFFDRYEIVYADGDIYRVKEIYKK